MQYLCQENLGVRSQQAWVKVLCFTMATRRETMKNKAQCQGQAWSLHTTSANIFMDLMNTTLSEYRQQNEHLLRNANTGVLRPGLSVLTCWLSSVMDRKVFITSSAFLASIIPQLNADVAAHATEYANTYG